MPGGDGVQLIGVHGKVRSITNRTCLRKWGFVGCLGCAGWCCGWGIGGKCGGSLWKAERAAADAIIDDFLVS